MSKRQLPKLILLLALIAYPTLCYMIDSIYMFVVTCIIVSMIWVITYDEDNKKESTVYMIQIASFFMFIVGIVALELILAFVASAVLFGTVIYKSEKLKENKNEN